MAVALMLGGLGAAPGGGALAAETAVAAGPGGADCEARDRAFRHTDGDGHDHTMGPEHRGHGHGEKTHNYKGYALKPRCPDARRDAASAPLADRSNVQGRGDRP
ncbi:hypothetical protein JOD31_001262 [Methylopila capsulata]|nr:hypothetical protein [Methylopila capsulata]MBM7851037.1 hypothetical protein [Methylopila capsulata]